MDINEIQSKASAYIEARESDDFRTGYLALQDLKASIPPGWALAMDSNGSIFINHCTERRMQTLFWAPDWWPDVEAEPCHWTYWNGAAMNHIPGKLTREEARQFVARTEERLKVLFADSKCSLMHCYRYISDMFHMIDMQNW